MSLAPRPAVLATHPVQHSIMEDVSDSESDPELVAELEFDPDQQQFYARQQQQALYYQQHTAMYGSTTDLTRPSSKNEKPESSDEDSGMYSDDGESSVASIPDENIDYSLTYAFHTFVAAVDGQASVVKGDSLQLLDDANSYWWLVRVLKTEDVGYIPAENIETPYERLARLNKHRNVDLAAATQQEKQAGAVQGREKLKGMIAGRGRSLREKSGETEDTASRRVFFAPPTYVEHPGVTWSSDEESEGEMEGAEGDYAVDEAMGDADEEDDPRFEGDDVDRSLDGHGVSMLDMEPDDGVEWADEAVVEERRRQNDANKAAVSSANPVNTQVNSATVPTSSTAAMTNGHDLGPTLGLKPSTSNNSLASNASSNYDPAEAGQTRRVTATPPVAQVTPGILLPSAVAATSATRNVSGQSVNSVQSTVSNASSTRSGTPTSPEESKKMKKQRKEESGEKRRSKGMLGSFFSRNKDKSKKGISSSDPRTSEESIVSGPVDNSSRRSSEDHRRAPTPAIVASPTQAQISSVSSHGLRLQQRDQALQQAYTDKYLRSPTIENRPQFGESTAAAAQSAAAARMASLGSAKGKRPASIIVSPNPSGPPLLNVLRVFVGDNVTANASFKTVLLNETTSSNDLIRQLIQRFDLPVQHADTPDGGYFLTVKDVSGEEMQIGPEEKPLPLFQEAVQRWASDEDEPNDFLRAATPTVKRSSVSSISSLASLSNHPAISRLNLNDFQDDSTVKIFIHRRTQPITQIPQSNSNLDSELSHYSSTLSSVHEVQQETTPEMESMDRFADSSPSGGTHDESGPSTPQAQPRYNPSLTVSTSGQPSPERFSSPSARFTVQLVIHPADLPDSSAFDPTSEAIVSRQIARDRQGPTTAAMDVRKRLFQVPRNATVVEATEQGLERFGIQEGVVDGGDDIEDRGSKRSSARVRYSLTAIIDGNERRLTPSSKVLDAYATMPQMRPVERMSMEQRRRSRDLSQTAGTLADILPSDPVFVLRRVQLRPTSSTLVHRQLQSEPASPSRQPKESSSVPMSPQEIIAAQRAASRANQKALISAHGNTAKGVDVVLPDRGTVRSSRLFDGEDEIVRYSFIEENGETYDISEILEEELGEEALKPVVSKVQLPINRKPTLYRTHTDSSGYITAPSTPDDVTELTMPTVGLERRGSRDILQNVLERTGGKPDSAVEERLHRVIIKAKSNSSIRGPETTRETPVQEERESGRTTPQARRMEDSPEDSWADRTPRASHILESTAADVNRIVSRHRTQPSIASIMSDISGSPAPESIIGTDSPDRDMRGLSTGASTPMTTNSTPPYSSSAVFVRNVASMSPTPKSPVSYVDDFGIKSMLAIVDLRTRDAKPRKSVRATDVDNVQRSLYGDRIQWDDVHPEVKTFFTGVAHKLDLFDQEVDGLLASVYAGRGNTVKRAPGGSF